VTHYVPPARIRVIAVALIEHPSSGALFVAEFADRDGRVFHRPCGGGVEFGETAAQALQREFDEEFGAAMEVGDRVAALESIFEFNGAPCHEIVLVHRARFLDPAFHEDRRYPVRAAPHDTGVWRPLNGADGIPLYPVGMAALLSGSQVLSRPGPPSPFSRVARTARRGPGTSRLLDGRC